MDKAVRIPSAEVGTLQTCVRRNMSPRNFPIPPTGREEQRLSCESWEWRQATRENRAIRASEPLLANQGPALKPRDFDPNSISYSL